MVDAQAVVLAKVLVGEYTLGVKDMYGRPPVSSINQHMHEEEDDRHHPPTHLPWLASSHQSSRRGGRRSLNEWLRAGWLTGHGGLCV